MIDTEAKKTLDFKRISLEDKQVYDEYLAHEGERGCEFSFANLYLWGRQSILEREERILIFSQFDRRSVYPFPLGDGDLRSAIDAIIADSRARGIPCRISGITESNRELLEELYPEKFRYHSDEGSYDYVYSVDDLADLSGKRYDGKRNHIRRFKDAYPKAKVIPLTAQNVEMAEIFTEEWYKKRIAENPDADFHMERAALTRALRSIDALGLIGLMLIDGEEVLAFTLASKLSSDTLDVHFEKARADVQGAYAAINCELARYVRENYPEIAYLDREEDMGLEGLRRAKRSYHPIRMIKKHWACLLEDGYDY